MKPRLGGPLRTVAARACRPAHQRRRADPHLRRKLLSRAGFRRGKRDRLLPDPGALRLQEMHPGPTLEQVRR